MTKTEREDIASLVRRIPCELSISTYDHARKGSAWLGCMECSRCTLLRYLEGSTDPMFEKLRDDIREDLLTRPENGGYELREDLRSRKS